MSVETVLSGLKINRDFRSNVVAWERIRPRRSRFGTMPPLSKSIQTALATQGIDQLYLHQSNAIEASLNSKNVVIATNTASGKTLCYNLPVLETLHQQPYARALYLFPTKALAQDQLAALKQLIANGNLHTSVSTYDGDTPRSQRSKIRRESQIILSNPDMLHAGILPYHTSWRNFFANLRYIVVDEIHSYRGVFGSHVANTLRRLQRICQFYGGDLQFVCCSATIANPKEHAETLCAAPFTLIDESQNGAPQGEKHFILYNPPVIDEELGLRQSVVLTAMEAASAFLSAEVQTVVFARSRQAVELLLGYLRDTLNFSQRDDGTTPQQTISGYRGGYLPLERREIELGLRSGKVRGVVATNALELGVDIGALDAAVLTGYPGSIASVWQQAGRAGRREGMAAVVMVAGNAPLDQYICKHPRYLFGSSAENALINPDNLQIAINHLLCAAFELPFSAGEHWGGLGEADELLSFLADEGSLHKTKTRSGDRYHWAGEGTPSSTVSLRTNGTDNVVIQVIPAEQEKGDRPPNAEYHQRRNSPNTLGEVDLHRAAVTVHEDAIYLHAGKSYIVEEFDYAARIAHVRPIETDYYTYASVGSDIRSLEPAQEVNENGLLRAHGELQIVTKATNYRKVRRYSQETLGMGKIDLPEWELDTTGYWLIFGEDLSEKLFEMGVLFRPNDYGPNWAHQRKLAIERDNHKCRTCGNTTMLQVHHVRSFKEYNYIRGVNENYLIANQIENLATLCASCHRQAEISVQQRSAMGGLAYVLRNLAPLFLMCDTGDIQVVASTRNPLTHAPTVVVYESMTAGVGFSQKLFELHHDLLRAALELVNDCNCRDGCPACVGPPGEIGPNTKSVTKQLLKILSRM
ncbi:MAG: DEAD/DEAH box helicase [Candidatus Promineifilaceae bacterium]